MYLIDTTVLIALFDQTLPSHRRAMEMLKGVESGSKVIIPLFAAAEFLLGIPEKHREQAEQFLGHLTSREFEPAIPRDLEKISKIRDHRRKFTSANDLLTVAIASRYRAKLLTLDTTIAKLFSQVSIN